MGKIEGLTKEIMDAAEKHVQEKWSTPYGKPGSREYNRWYLKCRVSKEDFIAGALYIKNLKP